MPWPSLLVMVRHAESEGNILTPDQRAEHESANWAFALTPQGREQARITGEYLRRVYGRFDIYYTSYYRRARETMSILFPEARIYEDPRLAEAQRGIYHTMTRQQIAEKYPEELIRKEREGAYHYRPPGGENWPDVELRIHSFMGTLARDYAGKSVLIVVHGHWLILWQRLVHHFSIDDEAVDRYCADGICANAGVVVYSGEEHLKFTQYVVPWQEGETAAAVTSLA